MHRHVVFVTNIHAHSGQNVELLRVQEAQRTHVDDRAPVQKQRAKKFNLQEEAERIRKHHIENEYKNKPISR